MQLDERRRSGNQSASWRSDHGSYAADPGDGNRGRAGVHRRQGTHLRNDVAFLLLVGCLWYLTHFKKTDFRAPVNHARVDLHAIAVDDLGSLRHLDVRSDSRDLSIADDD